MSVFRFIRQFFMIALFIPFTVSYSEAQITGVTNDQATPIPGVGHDYVKMLSETVQPSNGQLSIRIDVPTRPGRGITVPFAYIYNSAGLHHMVATGNGHFLWVSDVADNQGQGWSTSSPTLSAIKRTQNTNFPGPPPYTASCVYFTSYVFQDPSGGRHLLGLQTAQSSDFNSPNKCGQGGGAPGNVLTASDGIYTANTTAPSPDTVPSQPTPVTVVGPDGTVYNFSAIPQIYNGWVIFFRGGVDSIEDRNGNVVNAGGDTLHGSAQPIPFTPVSGNATWQGFAFNFTPQAVIPQANCFDPTSGPGSSLASASAYSSIGLPNGKSYQFQYESVYGMVSKITYPTGGYVSYTWGLNPNSESVSGTDNQNLACVYSYDTPAVTRRSVSFDGVNVALQQDFSYSTTWGNGWTSKQTIVTTHDCARNNFNCAAAPSFQTIYNYSPEGTGFYFGQAAVEQSIIYKDFNGNTLRTVTKGWSDSYRQACKLTTLDDGKISGSFYSYGSGGEVTDKKEYDYGLISSTSTCHDSAVAPTGITATRETAVAYQSFPPTPIFPAASSIFSRPATVQTFSAATLIAETDFAYDQTSLAAVSPVAYNHDEANYGPSSVAPRGNATTITRKCLQTCGSSILTYTFDLTGQVLSRTDSCGNASCADMIGTNHTTLYSYADNFDSNPPSNTNAYLTKVTDPFGHFSTFKYALSDGQLIASTEQNGKTTSYQYGDVLHRPTETDFPDGGKSTISYNDTAPTPSVTTTRLITTTPSTLNLSTTSIMDGLGHVTQTQLTTDPDGTTYTDVTNAGTGQVWKQSNPHRSSSASTDGITTNYFDGIGRICLVVPPDGTLPTGSDCPTSQPSNTIFTTYSGNAITVTDQAGKSRKSVTDGLGRLTQVFEDPANLNYETDYSYDVLSNLLTVNQKGGSTNSANWRTRTFTYDSLSRLLTAINPESGTISYLYDANSNLSTKTSPKPNQSGTATVVATYSYDALNRLTQKTFNDGSTPTGKYVYDGSTAPTGCTLPILTISNGIGRRTGMCDAAGSEAWSFDSMGRVAADARTTNGLSNTFSYTYNLDGSPLSEVHPINTLTINSVQGGAGRLVSETSSDANYAYNVHYTASGALCYMNSGWGQTFTHVWTFNNRLQPARIQLYGTGHGPTNSVCPAASTDATVALDLGYTYLDASGHNNGNVVTITNTPAYNRSQTFTYDSLNRLATAQTTANHSQDATDCWAETYGYDPWGNLVTLGPDPVGQSGFTGCTQESGFNFAGSIGTNNRITASGYGYDAAGNLTTNPGVGTLVYNAENQLVSSGGVTYVYDGDGKRITKAPSNTPTQPNYIYWYGSSNSPVIETNGSGAFQYRYISFNGMRVSREEANDWVDHYGLDILGNIRYVYGNNGSSDISDFYPFGGERVVQSSTNNHFKFSGKERDSESGLDNFGARFDSSVLGRFISPDWSPNPEPVPFSDLDNPQSLNLYAYVLNNPVNRVDAGGHAGREQLPGTNYTIRKDTHNPTDMPNIHVFDKKGNEVGNLRFQGDGGFHWDSNKLGASIREQVEAIARAENYAALAIERQVAMNAARAARGARGLRGANEAISILMVVDLALDAIYAHQTEVNEPTTGWHYDQLTGTNVITDVDKAGQYFPPGSTLGFVGESGSYMEIYTLGNDGRWRDRHGHYLYQCGQGQICTSAGMA
ncbi:MAG TPA: RHS repeat-associated core domain-containing protein [Candidatus Dormibacteraeota bacterium]|jgi:RHS repeat-associated protein|nr:RHS repeat-associated core domain-containing protein [Candidatus Dormibacteraeota bacterium]